MSALTDAPIAALEKQFDGSGYGDLKVAVADAFVATATPFRERVTSLLDDPAELDRRLADGAARARAVATPTLAQVYDRVGFLAPAQ